MTPSAYPASPYPLTDNPLVVAVLFLFVLLTLFSVGQNGLLRHELSWLSHMRSGRSFELPASASGFFRLLLMLQTFLFSGLCLYFAVVPESNLSAESVDWPTFALTMALPLLLYLYQWFCFRWTAYLAHDEERVLLLDRAYQALYLLIGPFALVLFVVQVTGHLSNTMEITLIAGLYGLALIWFIISAFKIFFRGIDTICFIIFYLCTLEIAPLYLMYQKMVA
jgi:hypothetical protein